MRPERFPEGGDSLVEGHNADLGIICYQAWDVLFSIRFTSWMRRDAAVLTLILSSNSVCFVSCL